MRNRFSKLTPYQNNSFTDSHCGGPCNDFSYKKRHFLEFSWEKNESKTCLGASKSLKFVHLMFPSDYKMAHFAHRNKSFFTTTVMYTPKRSSSIFIMCAQMCAKIKFSNKGLKNFFYEIPGKFFFTYWTKMNFIFFTFSSLFYRFKLVYQSCVKSGL